MIPYEEIDDKLKQWIKDNNATIPSLDTIEGVEEFSKPFFNDIGWTLQDYRNEHTRRIKNGNDK